MRKKSVASVFHYVPLHSSLAGRKFGRFNGDDRFTTAESERLVRLPLYYGMLPGDALQAVEAVRDFCGKL